MYRIPSHDLHDLPLAARCNILSQGIYSEVFNLLIAPSSAPDPSSTTSRTQPTTHSGVRATRRSEHFGWRSPMSMAVLAPFHLFTASVLLKPSEFAMSSSDQRF